MPVYGGRLLTDSDEALSGESMYEDERLRLVSIKEQAVVIQ
jgi:hypothetical protein